MLLRKSSPKIFEQHLQYGEVVDTPQDDSKSDEEIIPSLFIHPIKMADHWHQTRVKEPSHASGDVRFLNGQEVENEDISPFLNSAMLEEEDQTDSYGIQSVESNPYSHRKKLKLKELEIDHLSLEEKNVVINWFVNSKTKDYHQQVAEIGTILHTLILTLYTSIGIFSIFANQQHIHMLLGKKEQMKKLGGHQNYLRKKSQI
jgi:hypothetical protein